MGQELYHMDKGDFAVIFPDVMHHYQVFSPGINRAWYLWAGMPLTGQFADTLQKSCPDNPVITSKNLHPDIRTEKHPLEYSHWIQRAVRLCCEVK